MFLLTFKLNVIIVHIHDYNQKMSLGYSCQCTVAASHAQRCPLAESEGGSGEQALRFNIITKI